MKVFGVDTQKREACHLDNLSIKSFLVREFPSPLLQNLLIENLKTIFPKLIEGSHDS